MRAWHSQSLFIVSHVQVEDDTRKRLPRPSQETLFLKLSCHRPCGQGALAAFNSLVNALEIFAGTVPKSELTSPLATTVLFFGSTTT
jgi:hypothetical protein